MKKIDLNGEYRLYSYEYQNAPANPEQVSGGWIAATVPGNIELDYQRAEMLPDVFFAKNNQAAQALERKDFWYVRTFELLEAFDDTDAYLCFDGVDTLAEYFLNGEKIGESENMFIGSEFLVTNLLKPGENTLAVHIRSAIEEAKHYDIRPYNVAFPGCYENLHIRKAAINYGWDISPRLLSAGIWKDVRLELRDKVRFSDVYLTTASVYDNVAVLVLSVNTQQTDGILGRCELRISGKCKEHSFANTYPLPHQSATVYPYVYDPKLWWPNGAGEQNLYDISVELLCDGEVLAKYPLRFGIRTVKLDFGEKTGDEGKFRLLVNNKPLRCRGANWVPVSLLYSQSRAGYPAAVKHFYDCNCNLVRVWGGGIYEGDEFFDLCDEYGILVWQDMMLSCHAYPMDDAFYLAMCNEAEAVALRIRNHPSLAFYCGGNETDWPYVCVGLDPNDDRISRGALKDTLWQFDPYRSYYPSTPFFSREFIREHGGRFYLDLDEIKKERTSLPEEHLWWYREDFRSAKEHNHKFIGEIGYSGAPEKTSRDRFLPENAAFEDDAAWENHSYPTEGSRITGNDYLFKNIPAGEEYEASRCYQAEAYKYITELCRIRLYCNGILLWTMRENWPSFSSAMVDFYDKRKPSFDVVRQSYEPLQCIMDQENETVCVYLVNDTGKAQSVTVKILDEARNVLFVRQTELAEDKIVTELPSLPARDGSVLFSEIHCENRIIKNYLYMYFDRIDYPAYRKAIE